jgi:hypothetical protein
MAGSRQQSQHIEELYGLKMASLNPWYLSRELAISF